MTSDPKSEQPQPGEPQPGEPQPGEQGAQTEQAKVHLRVLGETRVVSFCVRLWQAPLDDMLPMARALSDESHTTAVEHIRSQGKTLSCAKGCAACCTTTLRRRRHSHRSHRFQYTSAPPHARAADGSQPLPAGQKSVSRGV